MAKKNEKLGTLKATDLKIGNCYPVTYSSFGMKVGSRGRFLSASFIIQTDENNENSKVWVNTPSEKDAYKVVGILTSALSNGHKLTIKSLTPVKNGNYTSFVYDVEEYISEGETLNPDDFETL